MNYNHGSNYNGGDQYYNRPNIPKPTSSGQLPNQHPHSNQRADANFQPHQTSAYFQGHQTFGATQGYGQNYYGSYPQYYYPAQQAPYYAGGYQGYIANYASPAEPPKEAVKNNSAERKSVISYDDTDTETNIISQDQNGGSKEKRHSEVGTPDDPKETIEAENKEAKIIAIPGTSITLESEEDIKKWREERRKMWLVKISNQREKHKSDLGIEEEDVSRNEAFQQVKRDKQFIQSIQNQINRSGPSPNLDLKLIQRTMAKENIKLLNFIKELGDAGLLQYELKEEEKQKLFGSNSRQPGARTNFNNKRPNTPHEGPSRYEGSKKRQHKPN
ncbi:Rsa1p [Lachancea thermotolerans CBS 6340]|uniref:KLTH0H04598p n=1 Tax=Lachancea thermotolerans (strain ATCC 56472 / CBS 6340 / NRRL Y-8284) TaxID=559295 RepID=C5E2F8_LACTC|nr:KLTH0H04598p [Lachancea thermotolerans CBS 6340]CAR30219.1 KLTH0H04598p [Lachancea thermotolerans CBS 6340]